MTAPRPPLHTHRVFLDSSCFLALVNPHDAHHQEARAIWTDLTQERWTAFTTNFVVAEAHALFLGRLGQIHATAFLRQVDRSSTTIVRATAQDEEQARVTIFRYQDHDFSLTDTISFAVMARLRIGAAFTFDRHFAQYGLTVLRA
jgi:predicted nucleic acid-binding protein